jgi:hypothetical protein
VFQKQQKLLEEQMASLIETGPMAVFGDLARQNLRIWQSMQESLLQAYGPRASSEEESREKKPG